MQRKYRQRHAALYPFRQQRKILKPAFRRQPALTDCCAKGAPLTYIINSNHLLPHFRNLKISLLRRKLLSGIGKKWHTEPL